ncbi:hypothetical protein D9613_008667 [Agrocybe pediades]|uniref:RING-type domain-containing protein n=1 Tax=Agrocybe pediades TaxID=84607 RepID=A0A8H4QUR8_9AGAR|nr:hypothetical protein D9613_008667 [Agrocybe pediades]
MPIICQHCNNRPFVNREAQIQHLNSSSVPHPSCDRCNRRFTSEAALDAHVRDAHRPTFSCTACERTFDTPDALAGHFRGSRAHPNCARCGEGFENQAKCTEHLQVAHPKAKCLHCSVVVYEEDLGRHSLDSRDHPKCTECQIGFKDGDALAKHKEEVHPSQVSSTAEETLVEEKPAIELPAQLQSTGFTPLSPQSRAQHGLFGRTLTGGTASPDLRLRVGFASPLVEVKPVFSPICLPHAGEKAERSIWSVKEEEVRNFQAMAARSNAASLSGSAGSSASSLPQRFQRQATPPARPPPRLQSSSSRVNTAVIPYNPQHNLPFNPKPRPSLSALRTSRQGGSTDVRGSQAEGSTSGQLTREAVPNPARTFAEVAWRSGPSVSSPARASSSTTSGTASTAARSQGGYASSSSSTLASDPSPVYGSNSHIPSIEVWVPSSASTTSTKLASTASTPSMKDGLTVYDSCEWLDSPSVASPVGFGLPQAPPSASSSTDDDDSDMGLTIYGGLTFEQNAAILIAEESVLANSPGERLSPNLLHVREEDDAAKLGSAPSPISAHGPVRRNSWTSLQAVMPSIISPPSAMERTTSTSSTATQLHERPLHCRLCDKDKCRDITATFCGHIFCNPCITKYVMANGCCPVCYTPTLLYCLFRLDLAA